jgi:hypothetical protein
MLAGQDVLACKLRFIVNGDPWRRIPGTEQTLRCCSTKESSMAEPRQPDDENKAQSGVKPGATPNTPGPKGGKRPVEEEDVFGGAERTRKGQNVDSPNTKP